MNFKLRIFDCGLRNLSFEGVGLYAPWKFRYAGMDSFFNLI